MGLQETELLFQTLWIGNIVGIHARYVLAAGTLNALVQTRSQFEATPVAPDHDARVTEGLRQRATGVGGTIVAKQQLPIRISLQLNRADGCANGACGVVKRHGDAYQGFAHSVA